MASYFEIKKQIRAVSAEIAELESSKEAENTKISQYEKLLEALEDAAGYLALGIGNILNAYQLFAAGYEGTGKGVDYLDEISRGKEEINDCYQDVLKCKNKAAEQLSEHQQKLEDLDDEIAELNEKLTQLRLGQA